ncbi:MAG: class I SAM-dependent methyltransferase [Anaeroplasma bactoclasticum]|nr:class I SAM-dependent methyltransferase [Anaeroplasma bactoclasticum]
MYKIVEFSHLLIQEHYYRLHKEDVLFVDATCGMGQDTLYMAELLHHQGQIVAYDIQNIAIDQTKQLLLEKGYTNVTYKLQSHEYLNEIADLVIYNCGYLPGHDKHLTTKASSTLMSIQKAIEMMATNPDLLIILVLYPGHPEGKMESDVLDDFCQKLPGASYLVCKYQNYNRPTSPYIITISKNTFKQHIHQ